MSRFTLRLVTLAAVVGAVVLGSAAVAIANSTTGSQNTDLTVTASMQSSGPDSERATVGDTVTIGSSLTNNTSSVLKSDASAIIVGPGAGGFAMEVKGGNRAGKSLAGKQVTVIVDEQTKIRKHGKATIADLAAGDHLNVQGRACKLDSQALTLLARHVVVTGGDDDKKDDDEGTTTGTTTSSETTSTESTTTS